MKVGSLFAGVGGFDIAAERAGMEVVWQSESDTKASAVLDHHWPDTNLGDIHGISFDTRQHAEFTAPAVDVLTGGFPCQDYSVAGNRSGLVGDRGALWWEFHRLIAEGHPRWVVGENVPGLLSSRGGRDFATIIDSLTELGYGVVWRILDAQYFGVAQRRRRLFIVGHSDGRPRPEVLALTEGLSGYPQPSREAREESATGTTGSTGIGGHQLQAELIGRNPDAGPNGKGVTDIAADPAYTLNVAGGVQAVAFNANQDPDAREDLSPSLIAGDHSANAIGLVTGFSSSGKDITGSITTAFGPKNYSNVQEVSAGSLVAFTQNQREEVRDLNDLAGALAAEPGMKQQTYVMRQREGKPGGGKGPLLNKEQSLTLAATSNDQTLFQGSVVRRLTPLECERLQGFPDNWTDTEGNSDSQRYKQMGNALAIPVVEWIMKRIAAADG